jgi:hypothetical protein
VSQRRKAIATTVLIAAFATGLLPATDAWASGSSEVQELRREISQIRSDLQALQAAVTEATELERQRSANLARALKDGGAAPAQPPAPAQAPAPPVAATEAVTAPAAPASSATSDDKDRRGSRKRRHKRSPRVPWKSSRQKASTSAR